MAYRRFVWRTGLAVVLAALTGCGNDVSGPAAIEGIYQLRLLNGEQLPYDHEGLGCCTYLSGAFRVESGKYEVSITAHNRNTDLVFAATEWGSYIRQGSSLTFALDSADVTPLLLDVAAVSTDSLWVAFGGEGPGSPDQFQALFVRSP